MQTTQLAQESTGRTPQLCHRLRSSSKRQREEAEGSPGSRTKSITDFFKPVQISSERIVVSSQLNGVCSEAIHLAASNAERLKKNLKISSPARKRRNLPVTSPSRSPIVEAFLRGVKQEKLNASNSLTSNHLKCHESLASPKTVIRRLLSDYTPSCDDSLNDSFEKKEGRTADDGIFSLPANPGQQTEGAIVGYDASDYNMWSQTSETDVLRDRGRGFGKLDNIPSKHQKLKSFRKSHSVLDNSQIAVGPCHANDGGKSFHKSREEHSLSLMASFSELSNLSSQENGSLFRDGPSQRTNIPALGSSPCIQSYDPGILSPENPVSEQLAIQSNLILRTSPRDGMPSHIFSHKGLGFNTKQKQSGHSVLQSTRTSEELIYDCSLRHSEEARTTNICHLENGLTVPSDGVQNLKKAVVAQIPETVLTGVSLENEQATEIDSPNSSLMEVGIVAVKYGYPNSHDCSKEVLTSGVNPMKKNKLTVSPQRILDFNFGQMPKHSSFSQSPVDLQLEVFQPCCTSSKQFVIDSKHVVCSDAGTPQSTEQILKLSQTCMPSLDVLGKFSTEMDVDCAVCSQSLGDGFSSRSSSLNSEMYSPFLIDNCQSDDKCKYNSDSDDHFECNLDSEEDDDILKPLEEIMQMTSKPPAASPEKASLEVFSSQESTTPSKATFTVCSPVAYTNSLDRLLKEKEDSKRLDDLEKKLKGDLEQGMGIFCPFEEEMNTDEDGPLLDEHREFIQRFSVVTDAIPDIHPGEEIFHFSDSGKLFSQHTLDLKNFNVIPQREEEKLILSSGKTQQLMFITQGFLTLIYRFVKCPVPILKFLFQMMSVHSDYIVSIQILNTLMDITVANFSAGDEQFRPWTPSIFDVAIVFINMGVPFTSLFSLENVQPDFTEADILVELGKSESKDNHSQALIKQDFSRVPEANIFNVVKFLGLCTAIYPEGYKDDEIMQLLILLFKIRLAKQLKQIPLVDIHCLLENLLKNINDWGVKMPEICLCISELSSHHHNLLKLVHLVPNSVARGRQLRRRLSLVIISKLLGKKRMCLPEDSNLQMSVLCQYLIEMKPSALTKKMMAEEKAEQHNDFPLSLLKAKVEQKAYYLTHSLLSLVNEASYLDACSPNHRKFIQKLSYALEKHVKCDIREDARLFYKTKVKDLVARIHGKWQEILNNSKPSEGKLHDYWEPVFESQSPTGKYEEQIENVTEMYPIEDDMEEITEDLKSN